ncbi:MAG TPA: ring-cleaving dioxygenase [Gemmatimonadales bacterium]|jgi:glyoxalase family protein|nr:ring-cleaving dioxygenase [Gemmatimonadales bacterium]
MDPLIQGLHHVTATVNDAQQDLEFYASLLGLRLVKKTVNFDNHHVFHFYYGDERGTPGTLMTTFPYKGKGVPLGRKGAGQITATAFSVPAGSLGGWRERLAGQGVTVREEGRRWEEEFIAFADPSGLTIELIANSRDARGSWHAVDVDPTIAIRGIHSVTLTIAIPEPSFALLVEVLGYAIVAEAEGRTRLEVHDGGPGRTLDILAAPEAPVALNGLGTVHHVAMAVESAEAQLAYRKQLVRLGVPVTEVLDRQYFQSIYFREPGGVLYEIATIPPGFLVDEELPSLGRALKLPPWEEPHRQLIEAGLPAVIHP